MTITLSIVQMAQKTGELVSQTRFLLSIVQMAEHT